MDDVLDGDRPLPHASLSVKDFTEQWLTPEQHHHVVVEETGELAGVPSLHRLQRVPRESWETTTISSLLHRRPPLASPHEPIDDVLERMADHRIPPSPLSIQVRGNSSAR